jgi:hypothetical protein
MVNNSFQNVNTKLILSVSPGDPLKASKHAKDWIAVEVKSIPEISNIVTKKVWSPIIWREGKRTQQNYISASLAVIDIDDGISIEHADEICLRSRISFIIGTTKNHRLPKGEKSACDRFRIITKFDCQITNFRDYKYNISKLIKSFGGDNCSDGARFFFPCKEIYSFNSGFAIPVEPYEESQVKQNILMKAKISGKLPSYILNFIKFGHVPPAFPGRNQFIFCITKDMFKLGFPKEIIIDKIKNSPFDRTNFNEKELETVLNSAFKNVENEVIK